jgi:Vta1 C-terminal domain
MTNRYLVYFWCVLLITAPEQIAKAQKYCKWAGSALNYEDIKTAIDNLQKGESGNFHISIGVH